MVHKISLKTFNSIIVFLALVVLTYSPTTFGQARDGAAGSGGTYYCGDEKSPHSLNSLLRSQMKDLGSVYNEYMAFAKSVSEYLPELGRTLTHLEKHQFILLPDNCKLAPTIGSSQTELKIEFDSAIVYVSEKNDPMVYFIVLPIFFTQSYIEQNNRVLDLIHEALRARFFGPNHSGVSGRIANKIYSYFKSSEFSKTEDELENFARELGVEIFNTTYDDQIFSDFRKGIGYTKSEAQLRKQNSIELVKVSQQLHDAVTQVNAKRRAGYSFNIFDFVKECLTDADAQSFLENQCQIINANYLKLKQIEESNRSLKFRILDTAPNLISSFHNILTKDPDSHDQFYMMAFLIDDIGIYKNIHSNVVNYMRDVYQL